MTAGRAFRVEKPVLSASQNRVDVTVDIAGRLESARRRVAARTTSGLMLIDGEVSSVA
jgi:hypothetical protein